MDAKKNGQELAFPFVETREMQGESISFGLTKREEFAKAAMAGLLANSGGPIQANGMSGWNFCNCDSKQVAEWAVDLADALLCALSHSAGGE